MDAPALPQDSSADAFADEAVALVADWVSRAESGAGRKERVLANRLAELITDETAVAFTMQFVDRVARPETDSAAAHQLQILVEDSTVPSFLSPVDRVLLRLGTLVAPMLPAIAMPLARLRMRSLVGHLVADAAPRKLGQHLAAHRTQGFTSNVNLLGEMILGEAEAERRFARTLKAVKRSDVDYMSIKVSNLASQLDLWAYDATLARVVERLRTLYTTAEQATPPTFVNLDMEEYEDLDLTIEAFITLLDEKPELDAGIVLQAYLPDTFAALQRLVGWANDRHARGGGTIKVRLVKGANLAMERVEAEMHGWEQAPYPTKLESDANFKRCLDWVCHPEHLAGVRIGVASHNLFDVAWAHLLAEGRRVSDRVEFEMLQGMAPSHSHLVHEATGSMLLYTPVVSSTDFDVAIGYLFRRLEENASSDNFLRFLFSLQPGSEAFVHQEQIFRASLAARWDVSTSPRRRQDRTQAQAPAPTDIPFVNEPDTDPAIPANREWARQVVGRRPAQVREPITTTASAIDERLATARRGAASWSRLSGAERRAVLLDVAEALVHRRGALISAMVHEASKTVSQADPEVSEAIDFARYYADRALDLESYEGTFTPLGTIAVVPPWNFPVAIPAGGVLAALAAGNAVILKPAPETPRCAELVAEACWEAGVPTDVLQFVRTPDDDVGRHLVTHEGVDGLILTGSWDTAVLFRSWKPALRLFAETSGKNSMIVTPYADLDLAVADLVTSAFGHSGQKCSAASLGILVGEVFDSERFRRQLVDATVSLSVGPTSELASVVGPVILPPTGALARALSDTEARWLLEPRQLDAEGRLWSPGIVDAVAPGSWFHQTECFGPVLGLMRAETVEHALALQNATPYGLTGGIHTLDPHEITLWEENAQVGNGYINRHITGAIVQRQPFGGWKRSVVGPGGKAGGPNYVAQLGCWDSVAAPSDTAPPVDRASELLERFLHGLGTEDATWLRACAGSDQQWWEREYGAVHDPSGLAVEANRFRYRPRPEVAVRIERDARPSQALRTILACARAGVDLDISSPGEVPWLAAAGLEVTIEPTVTLIGRLQPWSRIRVVGGFDPEHLPTAHRAEIDLVDAPVAASGRIELLWYLREQSISQTLHRFGNLIGSG